MGKTRTIKNKHAANGSGIRGSMASKAASKATPDGIIRKKNPNTKSPLTQAHKGRPIMSDALKKKKKRVYTEKELGIPKLNSIVPAGVQKPKGKKKGKVFVDDIESMNTILAIAQAEKEGQIESKMIKARQLEEIREARRVEAEKKEAERKEKFEDTKNSLRKKRKRPQEEGGDKAEVKEISSLGSKASKPGKKKVSFAEE